MLRIVTENLGEANTLDPSAPQQEVSLRVQAPKGAPTGPTDSEEPWKPAQLERLSLYLTLLLLFQVRLRSQLGAWVKMGMMKLWRC